MIKGQRHLPTFKLKYLILIIMVIIVLLPNFLDIKIEFINDLFGIRLLNWFWGYVLAVAVAFVLHYAVYLLVGHSMKHEFKRLNTYQVVKSNLTCIKENILKFLITSDYIFASSFKEIIDQSKFSECTIRSKGGTHKYKDLEIACNKNDAGEYECEVHMKKKMRKTYIILCNWQNLTLSCFLIILTQLLVSPGIKNSGSELKEIFFIFLLFHITSRVFEICIAFYNDVVVPRMSPELEIGYRLSNLKRGNRISLAVHSYIELGLLFSLVYYIYQVSGNSNISLDNMILYSFSVMAFNFSFDDKFNTFQQVLHIAQVFSSITLVVLSIANYLGLKDEMNKYEKEDWKKGDYV